jgi:D-alanine-D-alanine ligase-like ATP-grasp enzyme
MIRDKAGWRLNLLRVRCRIRKILGRFARTNRPMYVWDRMPFYKQMWEHAASSLSADFLELGEGIWEIRNGHQRTRINNHVIQLDDPVTLNLAGNKTFCYSVMTKDGLPVPKHLSFLLHEMDKAKQFVKQQGGLFVVKPSIGTAGSMGITTHIMTVRELSRAVALASLYGKEIIIERLIPGECYRVLVLNDKVVHVSRRRGLWVHGDGESTIWRLVSKENESRQCHEKKSMCISSSDRDLMATLEAQGVSQETVPAIGQKVLVKSCAYPLKKHTEVLTVFNEDVTDLVCNDIRDKAIQAARILHSKFAGVDIISLDATIPLERSGGVVSEINTTPGLHHHYNLQYSEKRDPAVQVLRYLLNVTK